jgi:hypothetical protein
MNLKSNEWPTRYEVGMRFLRADGEVVEVEKTQDGGNVRIGSDNALAYYRHGERNDDAGGTHLRLLYWINPPISRDEVLRVATIIMQELSKRPDFDDMYGAGELATERAINLIDAVNKRMEGGDHAIR